MKLKKGYLFYVIYTVVAFLLLSLIVKSDVLAKSTVIKVHSVITQEQRTQENIDRNNSFKINKAIFDDEIKRRHEIRLETDKFKNAIMLERASAPNVSLNSFSSVRVSQIAGKNVKLKQSKINR